MGVTGLWKLLDRAGKQVTLESLEGQVFAVDASILLNQALKGMKDQPNAHLHVLFLRLCKLLMYKIKPIFVFDGSVPVLKRQTIAARQQRREEAAARAQSIQERLKRKAVQRLALSGSRGSPSPLKKMRNGETDLFELPPLPEAAAVEEDDGYYELPIHNMLYSGDIDLSQVKVDSEEFKSLPLEYQHEILEEMKELTKHNQLAFSLDETEKADNFSTFQISKLVKSNKLTNKIEELRKEMLASLADQADDPNCSLLQANRVMSEDATHYLLVKTNTFPAPAASTTVGSGSSSPVIERQQEPTSTANSIPPSRRSRPLKRRRGDKPYRHLVLSDSDSESSLVEEIPKQIADSRQSVAGSADLATDEPDLSLELSEQETDDELPGRVTPQSKHDLDLIRDHSNQRISTTETVEPKSSVADTSQRLAGHQLSLSTAQTAEAAREPVKSAEGSPSFEQSHPNIQQDKPSHVPGSSEVVSGLSPDASETDDDEFESIPVEEKGTELTNPIQPSSNPAFSGLADEILSSKGNLDKLNEELGTDQYYLNLDLQKQNASSVAVTQSILEDSMELLRLFGVPYIVSPSEAEAQCAQLEQLGLCQGTITEDSDVWLFGARKVLKNFFQPDRFVTSFSASDILAMCGLDREKLIAFALVCGSDYTDGILGAGPVTATEILSEFGRHCDGITAMKNFKSWADEVKSRDGILPVSSSNTSVRRKLARHVKMLPESFPNHVVVDAYLNPKVDDSGESFTWGRIDLDLLRKFGRKTLNWSTEKVDDLVCPVLKKINSTQTQPKVTDFFPSCTTSINTSPLFQSKRLKHAFAKLITPTDSVQTCPPPSTSTKPAQKPKPPRRATTAKVKAKGKGKAVKARPVVNMNLIKDEVCLSEESDD